MTVHEMTSSHANLFYNQGIVKPILNLKISLASSYLNPAKQTTEMGRIKPKITKEKTKANPETVAKELQAVIPERQEALIRDRAVAQGLCKIA
jgi:hypothetical protein